MGAGRNLAWGILSGIVAVLLFLLLAAFLADLPSPGDKGQVVEETATFAHVSGPALPPDTGKDVPQQAPAEQDEEPDPQQLEEPTEAEDAPEEAPLEQNSDENQDADLETAAPKQELAVEPESDESQTDEGAVEPPPGEDEANAAQVSEEETSEPPPPEDDEPMPQPEQSTGPLASSSPADDPKDEHVPKSALADGDIPPITHVGEVAKLWDKYPLREGAWILDREDTGDPKDKPRKQVVFVCAEKTDEPPLYWDVTKPGRPSADFKARTSLYDVDSLIAAKDPQKLGLWRHRAEIARLAGLPDAANRRVSWGYFRHVTETSRLAPAVSAYRRAVESQAIRPDPTKDHELRVEWGTASDGDIRVVAVHFVPGGEADSAIALSLPASP